MKNNTNWLNGNIFGFEDKQYSRQGYIDAFVASGLNPANTILTNPNLPCPKRIELMAIPQMILIFPTSFRNILVERVKHYESPSQIMENLMLLPRDMLEFFTGPIFPNDKTNLKEQTIKLMHHLQGDRIYTIRNDTAAKLEMTGVNDNIPVSMLKAPEPGIIYVEIGDDKPGMKSLSLQNPDDPYKEDYLEGFYYYEEELDIADIFARKISSKGETIKHVIENEFGYKGYDSVRTLNFHFESAVDLENETPIDTGFVFLNLQIPVYEDREIPLNEILEKHFAWWKKDALVVDQIGADELIDAEMESRSNNIKAASLISLYMTSSNIRQEHLDLTEARKRIELSGTKKKKNARKKALRAVDRIYISPKLDDDFTKKISQTTQGKKAFHIRMGHLRMQAYGEGRSKHKVIWIEPTFINAEKDSDPVIKQKKF